MDRKQDGVIGIVGGMGPEAGLALCNSILKHTPACTDQEHLPVVLMSYPSQMADRTDFLEGKTSVNPALSVARIVQQLELVGAGVVGIACNTIYVPAIFDVLQQELHRLHCSVNLLHMPLETCRHVAATYPFVKRIGLLSTNGTYRYGEYRYLLQQKGYEVILPDPVFQNEVVHRMIYDKKFGLKAKAGSVTEEAMVLMQTAVNFLKDQKAEIILLGCTELPATLNGLKEIQGLPVISSIDAMAQALIREALAKAGSARPMPCY